LISVLTVTSLRVQGFRVNRLKGNHLNILITGLVTWFLAWLLAWALDSWVRFPANSLPAFVWDVVMIVVPATAAVLVVKPIFALLGYIAIFYGLATACGCFAYSCIAGNFGHAAAFLAFFLVPVAVRLLVDWALSPFVEFRELTAEDGLAGRMEQRIRKMLRS